MTEAFKPGTCVLIDGTRAATVVQHFPKGSTTLSAPHYKINVEGGDRNVAVSVARVRACDRIATEIVITRRADDIHAAIKGAAEIWGCGRSINAAIGDLVNSHQERFGVKLVFADMGEYEREEG